MVRLAGRCRSHSSPVDSARAWQALILRAEPQRLELGKPALHGTGRRPGERLFLLAPGLEHLTRAFGLVAPGQRFETGDELAALEPDGPKAHGTAPSARSSSQVPPSQLPTCRSLRRYVVQRVRGLGLREIPTRSIRSVSMSVPSSSSAGSVASRQEPWPSAITYGTRGAVSADARVEGGRTPGTESPA